METNKNYQIFVSAIAAEQVNKQLLKRETPNSYIRLGIRGGSCSGFTYVLEFQDYPPRDKDLLFEVKNIKIIIDCKSILYLNGCTLDWEWTIMRHGFKFINPAEKSKCGCGGSFSV